MQTILERISEKDVTDWLVAKLAALKESHQLTAITIETSNDSEIPVRFFVHRDDKNGGDECGYSESAIENAVEDLVDELSS